MHVSNKAPVELLKSTGYVSTATPCSHSAGTTRCKANPSDWRTPATTAAWVPARPDSLHHNGGKLLEQVQIAHIQVAAAREQTGWGRLL